MKKPASISIARLRPVVSVMLALFLFGFLGTVGQPAQPSLPGSQAKNPQQIAILHWYAANQTTAFAVGVNPEGVAFDGANIWVANNGSNTVTKLRASDGANLGTFAVGGGPEGVAFDGANIWVTNS